MNRVFYTETRRRLKRERAVVRFKKLLLSSEKLKKFTHVRTLRKFHKISELEIGILFIALRELVAAGKVVELQRRIRSPVRPHVTFYKLV